MDIETAVAAQRGYFETGITKPLNFRKAALKALRESIASRERDIYTALHEDLRKSEFESYMCEVGLVLSELTYAEKHMARFESADM